VVVESQHVVVENCMNETNIVTALSDEDVRVVVEVDHHRLCFLRKLLEDVDNISSIVVFEMVEL
jgi:hypothetical protein